MASQFGKFFRVLTFGESHGPVVGAVIDGFPAGLHVDSSEIQSQLNRRRPGQSHLTTERQEGDECRIVSGLSDESISLGGPICVIVDNRDQRPSDYHELQGLFRPSHGDYTYWKKYGMPMPPGGGRASARETVGRVVAGALAEQLLRHGLKAMRIVAFVEEVGGTPAGSSWRDFSGGEMMPSRSLVDAQPSRCLSPDDDRTFQSLIMAARSEGDSLGGVIRCLVEGCPPGLGGPVFDKLEADLAKAMLSIPACRGFEIGSGFRGSRMKGSEHNDAFAPAAEGGMITTTNRSGGIQAGISNGALIDFRVAFKPPATIRRPQETIRTDGTAATLNPRAGRHDPCVLPRAVPIVEAMTALVLCEHFLEQRLHATFREP